MELLVDFCCPDLPTIHCLPFVSVLAAGILYRGAYKSLCFSVPCPVGRVRITLILNVGHTLGGNLLIGAM